MSKETRDQAVMRKTGLLGRGISYSLSPSLHVGAARRIGLSVSYVLLDMPRGASDSATVRDALKRCRDEGFVGLNITQPFKEDVIPLLDHVDDVALLLNAVNTIRFDDGSARGYNTDSYGFGMELAVAANDISRVVQFGAGGAGAATAHAALVAGAQELHILDPRVERAELLAQRLSAHFPSRTVQAGTLASAEEAMGTPAGVINASTQGSSAHRDSPVPAHLLRSALWVADVIYAPPLSDLVRDARVRQIPATNGGLMLVHQAARSFELFHDIAPDPDEMWQQFVQLTGGR